MYSCFEKQEWTGQLEASMEWTGKATIYKTTFNGIISVHCQ